MRPRPIRPDQVSATSREKFWFDCDVCGNHFKMSPYNITVRNLWCPFCFLERNKVFIQNVRKLAQSEKLEMVINPDFDWAPDCLYIYDKVGRKRGIVVRCTNILNPKEPEGDFTDRELELEEFLDEGAENSGIKVVRFTRQEILDSSEIWIDILTDFVHVLKGVPLRPPAESCRTCSNLTRRFCPNGCCTRYCSKECENDDWVAHRNFCFKRRKFTECKI